MSLLAIYILISLQFTQGRRAGDVGLEKSSQRRHGRDVALEKIRDKRSVDMLGELLGSICE